jgi:sterol desaturase/sphingolipid hydroxylase (fatty acid hydroxylase superfamily)
MGGNQCPSHSQVVEAVLRFVSSFGLITIAFVAVACLERIPALQFRRSPLLRPYLMTDAGWYLVAAGASALSTYAFQPILSHLVITSMRHRVAALNGFARIAIAVAIFDLIAFVVHVNIHRIDALWNVHKVHHSSLHLDWLATTRTHMFEHLVRNVPAMATLFVFGFSARTISLAIGVYALFAVHGHSNLDMNLRGIEWLFITPRLHRLHHIPATTQKNFGTVFSFWDRATHKLIRMNASPDDLLGVPGERDTYPQKFTVAAREPFRQNLAARRQLSDAVKS